MLSRLYVSLESITTARNIRLFGLASLLFFISFNLLMLPEQLATLVGYSGGQRLFLLDLGFNYSVEWAYATLAAYGENGRTAYLVMSLLFDFIFPITYSLFFATSLLALLRRLWPANSVWQKLALVAFLAGLADLLENACVIWLLLGYPQQLTSLAILANFLTLTKDFFILLNVILTLGGLGLLTYQKWHNPKGAITNNS